MEAEFSFNPLLIVTILAFLVPLVTNRIRRVRIPVVVGEILVGIVIGRSGLGLITDDRWLEFIATLGFTYLMFLSGLEIDFETLSRAFSRDKEKSRVATASPWTAMAFFALTLAASLGVSFGLARFELVKEPYFMALILSTTSLGIVMPVLKEKGLARTGFGQDILLAALTADFGTMLLITVVVALIAGEHAEEVLLVLFLFAAFFIVYRLGLRFTRLLTRLRIVDELAHATSQIGVRGSFMLIFVFVALAERLGSEVILGAFLAGAIVSLLSDRAGENLRLKLDAIGYGFFIPVFFIMVGVRFEAEALLQSPSAIRVIPVLLVALYAVKVLPAMLFSTYSLGERLAAGFLLSSRLSLIIAASDIGLRLGILTPELNAAVILVAIITSALSPILFDRIAPVAKDQKPVAIMIGASQESLVLAKRLRNHDWDVFVLDVDAGRVDIAREMGIESQVGDALDPDLVVGLAEKIQASSRAVLAITKDGKRNRAIARNAKRAGFSNIIATVDDPSLAEAMVDDGIRTVTPALSKLIVLENLVLHPDLFSVLIHDKDGDFSVEDAFLRNWLHAGDTLRDIPLPEGVLVIALSRGGERLIPYGNTVLNYGDRLTLVGGNSELRRAIEIITGGTASN